MEFIAEATVSTAIAEDHQEIPLPASAEARADERRREPRYPTDRLTLLYLTGSERILCRILDISDSGMRVRTQRQLDPGTEVRVTLREVCGIATVRYSVEVGQAFDHGLQVEAIEATDGTRAAPALSLLVT